MENQKKKEVNIWKQVGEDAGMSINWHQSKPLAPVVGDVYFDASIGECSIYSGGRWVKITVFNQARCLHIIGGQLFYTNKQGKSINMGPTSLFTARYKCEIKFLLNQIGMTAPFLNELRNYRNKIKKSKLGKILYGGN